ncbi:MAG: Lrp/AsnC ligand binding domain-containing protein [Dehalococcoidia bacterium]
MIRGFVLVETEVGRTRAVAEAIRALTPDTPEQHGAITAVDTVTGPYDVIVQVEAPDLDLLGKHITGEIATVPGVQRTTTCLAVNLD